jgi:hypothetical protein
MNSKAPLGVLIFAGLNTFFFGLLALIGSLLFIARPHFFENVMQTLSVNNTLMSTLSVHQVKELLYVQVVMATVYLLTGVGLFLRKEKARIATVYFSFVLLILVFISAVVQPRFAGQNIMNALYPVALIVYFTNKNVEQWFH